MAVTASDKDRWNLLSPAASKSLAKEFDFGDATKGGLGGVVKGKDRWNLLRDNVQSLSLQARGANAFSSVGRATSSPSQRIQLFSSTLRRAARQEKGEDLMESPGVLTASEPAPEPGVAGDSEVPPCQVEASLDTDLEGKTGKDEIGEEFSDWESEAGDNVVSADKHGFLTACDAIVASPAIHVLGPQESGPPSGLCGAEDVEVGGTKEAEAEADPDCPILGSAPPTGMKVEASTSGAPQSRRQSGAGEAAAVPDLVSRMLGGLPSWAAFAAADESEEEIHNAWGEHDTDDMLGLRAFELQQARGIEVPGTPTAAQARLAKRKQKAQEKAKRKTQLEVGATESTGGHLFGMMSMLSNLTSATATGSAHDDDEESVHNAWGGDDSDSKFVERTAELEHVRGMVVPVLKVQTGGRERLAKRRQRAEKKCNTHQGVAETRDGSATSYSGRAAASVFSAAATSIVQFQRLLNYVASTQDDEIDEVFCIWGEDDTPERFHERLAAMELARSDQSGRLPHHRVLRQKRKGRASYQKKEPDDPFLLDLRQQIE